MFWLFRRGWGWYSFLKILLGDFASALRYENFSSSVGRSFELFYGNVSFRFMTSISICFPLMFFFDFHRLKTLKTFLALYRLLSCVPTFSDSNSWLQSKLCYFLLCEEFCEENIISSGYRGSERRTILFFVCGDSGGGQLDGMQNPCVLEDVPL